MGSLIAVTPLLGRLYPLIKNKVSTTPIDRINKSTIVPTSVRTQLYGNSYYLNNSYQVAYRSSNTLGTFYAKNLSSVDILSGVTAKDSFYFALQDIEGTIIILWNSTI